MAIEMGKRKKATFSLPETLVNDVREFARRHRVDQAQVVQQALERLLNQQLEAELAEGYVHVRALDSAIMKEFADVDREAWPPA